MAPRIKPSILKITPYRAGESAIKGVDRVIKLSSNENSLGPSPKAVAAYEAAGKGMELYPDPSTRKLREALAAHWGLEADRIMTGTGSDQLLDLIALCYAGPGDEVLFPAMTFPVYEIATNAQGATVVKAPMDGDKISVDALIDAATDKTTICYLANPNNPTGDWLSKSEVVRLRAGLPENVLLVLDSAYAEYCDDPAYTAGADLVKAAIDSGANNVIMTRTFSKMYALAGLRVGWAYGPDDVMGALGRVRAPFSVSVPAAAAALAALEDTASMERSLAHNNKWLPILNNALRDAGFAVTEGKGNFVFFRVPESQGGWEAFNRFLNSKGIIVRPMPPAKALRMTIGSDDENEAFLAALCAFANDHAAA